MDVDKQKVLHIQKLSEAHKKVFDWYKGRSESVDFDLSIRKEGDSDEETIWLRHKSQPNQDRFKTLVTRTSDVHMIDQTDMVIEAIEVFLDSKRTEGKHLYHWETIQADHDMLHDFIEWLEDQYGLHLDWENASSGTTLSFGSLVDEYLGINRVGLENDRRALLEKQRLTNGQ